MIFAQSSVLLFLNLSIMTKVAVLSLLLSLVSHVAFAQSEITTEELRSHVIYLASDELQGRRAGTPGGDTAAAYIARAFQRYGLKGAGDNGSFLQRFSFISDVKINQSVLNVDRDGRARSYEAVDFRPLGFSAAGSVTGDIVFAGYGISAPTIHYDDYAGLDVKDKIVLVLRYWPKGDTIKRDFAPYSSLRYKALKAKEKGAKGIMIVTGPMDDDRDQLMRHNFDPSSGYAGIVTLNVTQRLANELLASANVDLKHLQEQIGTSGTPRSFIIAGAKATIQVDLELQNTVTNNVLGFIEGSDPVLKNEIVVIGAHYDHLGHGGEGSGSTKPDTMAIHNGADDNASGVAGLLELAQTFAARRQSLKRSVFFMAFAAEEIGLLGSGYFVKNPTVPIENVVAMLNMDMIGRLDNRKLVVYGTGTAPEFETLSRKHNAVPGGDSLFALRLIKDGYGPSDHSSFYGKKIPVFHFFTDAHVDYHRPSDDWDKLNYEGMTQVVHYIDRIATELNQRDTRPQYVAIEPPRMGGGGRGAGVYLGTIPDFGEQVEGVKLSGVREGSPAAKGGLTAGDIIVKLGTFDVKNLSDMTYAMGEHKPGDEVDVIVRRGSELKTLRVKLERRN